MSGTSKPVRIHFDKPTVPGMSVLLGDDGPDQIDLFSWLNERGIVVLADMDLNLAPNELVTLSLSLVVEGELDITGLDEESLLVSDLVTKAELIENLREEQE